MRMRMETEVDPAFFQAPEHRPKPTITEAGGIPLIDLSPLLSHNTSGSIPDDPLAFPTAWKELVEQMEVACREWGFFQVINHGVPQEVMDRAWTASKSFFALPPEEKQRVRRGELNPLGYYESEHTKNIRDWKEVFDLAVQEPFTLPANSGVDGGSIEIRNQWPQYPPGFREALEEYSQVVEELAFKLLELIALTLNLPAKRFNSFFKDQTTFLRLNHYPPCPSPHLALGVGRHKDSGALTVLAQDDVGGLNVKRRSDGEWVHIKPIPNSYIINVGDIIQVWSNDKYESAEHRVTVNSEKERFSIPFFFNPAHHVVVKPLEELIDCDNPAKYEQYNWGQFIVKRNNSNFKKLEAENLQISHYKKSNN